MNKPENTRKTRSQKRLILLLLTQQKSLGKIDYMGNSLTGGAGRRSGESTRLPQMWPGFDSRSRRHMRVQFVVGSHPCSASFSPDFPVFLPPQRTNISKFDLESVDEESLCGGATVNSNLFIYLVS